ncbi:respiratory chain complex I subunit 1 family protein [Candidatus Margulisiibacteriota bacterium]
MRELLISIFYYIVFPGFLFTAVVGLLSTWVDRKVTAKVQWRVGPPWFQPFADIFKLLGKELIVPSGVSVMGFLMPPLFGLAAVTLVSTIIWVINIWGLSFMGDLIVVIYLLTIPSLAVILGGSASRNPLAAIGASREMKLILSYELPFLIAIFTVIIKSGSILLSKITEYQAINGAIASNISCTIAFLVALLCIQAKLTFVPFDIPEAEQEIMGGPYIEYSGPALAVFKLTRAMMLFVLPVFLIMLFLGGINVMTWPGIGWFVLKYVLVLTGIILIKNTNPRLRIDQAMRFFWGPLTIVALISLVLAFLGV